MIAAVVIFLLGVAFMVPIHLQDRRTRTPARVARPRPSAPPTRSAGMPNPRPVPRGAR